MVARLKLAGGLIALMLHGAAFAAEPGDAPLTWSPAPSSVMLPSVDADVNAWKGFRMPPSRGATVEEKLEDPVLKGAIDLHAHFGPDTYPRQWDAFDIAKIDQARGMRGMVLKNHWSESAGIAFLVRKHGAVPGLEVFGSLSLNATVGGINPQAVRYFAEVEGHYGKVVWLPTHDAKEEVEVLKQRRPYVVVSDNGVLRPELLEVLDLIAEYKLTLGTGHVSADEMVQIVNEARKRGVDRIIITHPGLGEQYTDPSLTQLKQVVGEGAYVEIVTTALLLGNKAHALEIIRAVGPEHCFVASDSGLTGLPSHADALVKAARVLREEKFTEAELDLMFKTNPAKLLGLPVAPAR